MKMRDPVCSPIVKPLIAGLVVGSVMTSEYHARWLGKMGLKTNTSESVLRNRRSIHNCREMEKKMVQTKLWHQEKRCGPLLSLGNPDGDLPLEWKELPEDVRARNDLQDCMVDEHPFSLFVGKLCINLQPTFKV